MRSIIRTTLVFALVASSASGCVTVRPYEREILAHRAMQLDGGLGGAFRGHVVSIREGALGEAGGRGGGCGCN